MNLQVNGLLNKGKAVHRFNVSSEVSGLEFLLVLAPRAMKSPGIFPAQPRVLYELAVILTDVSSTLGTLPYCESSADTDQGRSCHRTPLRRSFSENCTFAISRRHDRRSLQSRQTQRRLRFSATEL
jgi:hypothetical protein